LLLYFTDDYDVARSKLNLAEETSTLETDQEDALQSRKRTKRKNTLFSDDEDVSNIVDKTAKKVTSKKLVESIVPVPEPPASLQG
jgi:hypothetical protein